MAGFWQVVVPAAGTNLCTNPSLEVDTSGWNPIGGGTTLTQTSDDQRRGVRALQVKPDSSPNAGTYYRLLSIAAGVHTFSVDVRGAAGVPMELVINDGSDHVVDTWTATGEWQRRAGSTTVVAGAINVSIRKAGSTSTADFIVDGLQIEAGAVESTYIDGTVPGCAWNGAAHESSSTRAATSQGGQYVDLSDYGISVQTAPGMGMAPVRNVLQEFGLRPGAYWQRQIAQQRTLTLQAALDGASQANLHSLRRQLIDALKPDRMPTQRTLMLAYRGLALNGTVPAGERMLYNLLYDSGLEGTTQSGFAEPALPLRFVGPDPFVYADGETAGEWLAPSTQFATNAYGLMRSATSAWASMQANGIIYAICPDPARNRLIVGGGFTQIGGISANRIAVYDLASGTWNSLGTGLDANCRAIAVAADGRIYAAGEFTTAGGSAAARIASWYGIGWSTLGSGLNGTAYALVVGYDGNVYVGGGFTSAGGVIGVNYLAKWNGTTWSGVGSAPNSQVRSLAWAADGSLYAGGTFTTIGGTSAARIARYSGSAWSALGTGCNNTVQAVVVGPRGLVYAGGTFTTAGGITVTGVAVWNGRIWSALGVTLTVGGGGITSLYWSDAVLYVGGEITQLDGVTAAGLVRYSGGTWARVDVIANASLVYAVAVQAGILAVGQNAATGYGSNTITVTNDGTADAYPVITVTCTGTSAILYSIINGTTGEALRFTLRLQPGEVVTIDLRPGAKTVTSAWRGNVYSGVLPGNMLASWHLAPGENVLSFFGDSGLTATIVCPITHWSADGGAA